VAEPFKADVTSAPIPRFDLLKFDSISISACNFRAACPFTCEFCDIIELTAARRAPRRASNACELDRLHELGYRGHVDFVDDNLIGNRRPESVPPHLVTWVEEKNYPFGILDRGVDQPVRRRGTALALEQGQTSFLVFVGLETPNTDRVVAMKKKRKADPVDSVHRICHGIFVPPGLSSASTPRRTVSPTKWSLHPGLGGSRSAWSAC